METALYGLVGVLFLGLASFFAWWVTASAFPLDHRFSEVVERSLPLQGRWLRTAARVVIFPVVLFCLIPGVAILTLAVVNILLVIGAILTW